MKVTDLETDLDWMWSKEKFNNRRYVMQEMFENYKEGDKWQLPEVRTNSFKPEKKWGHPTAEAQCLCVYYFSPDVTYFLIVPTTYYQEGVFLGGKFDVVCLSAMKFFIAYLTLFHIRKKVTRTCM